jgi:hypothetical protein
MVIIIKSLKYHPETGVELSSDEVFSIDKQHNNLFLIELLRGKEIIQNHNYKLKEELELLLKENLSLTRRLEDLTKEHEKLLKTKIFLERFDFYNMKWKIIKRLMKASINNQSYTKLANDIEFLENEKCVATMQ